MSRIYWDTMLFIYWLEDHPQYSRRMDTIYARMRARHDTLITASFTFAEVLAGAYRKAAPHLANEARGLLQRVVTEVVPFTLDTAEQYARIRGELRLPPADVIHLACAAQARTDLFLTNDKQLVGKIVPGIQFIASLDIELF